MANAVTRRASLNRVQKPSTRSTSARRAPAPARKQIPTPSPSTVQRTLRTPKASPRPQRGYEALIARAQEAGVPTPPSPVEVDARQVATREDTGFDSIPDYSPSLSTLNEDSRFRVQWKGTPLDLSNDPHKHLLHPAEIHLASVLRLSCAVYLTSKRRIFKAKVEGTRQGLRFNRTDSQKACKIDVNKASKLWSAYQSIGWFDEEFINPHLSRTPRVSPRSRRGGYGVSAQAQEAGTLSPNPVAAHTRQSTNREDTDFNSIPDYCPPLTTLGSDAKFKVEWKGTPRSLSNDPHKHLLHPAEIHLASILRLSCAVYLTSKRRIFRAKVEETRQGLRFNKTDSQKVCKIDVNKASKLWSAYDRIGWFDEKFITPHL